MPTDIPRSPGVVRAVSLVLAAGGGGGGAATVMSIIPRDLGLVRNSDQGDERASEHRRVQAFATGWCEMAAAEQQI